MDIKEIGF